jgi:glutamate formiminotransferase/formiminotetrahydrofolate cyclodeaminase
VDDASTAYASLTLAEFSERLASGDPVPGGGSASAVAGALAASLVAMVARLSLDRPKYEAYRSTHERALEFGEQARRRLLDLADDDATAYAGFSRARKMPRDTDEQLEARDATTRVAARAASDVPMRVVRECHLLLNEVEALAGRSNLNAASDLEVAGRLAAAAARGAGANVLINLPMVGDESYAGAMTAELNGLLIGIDRTLSSISEIVAGGTLRDPEQA